MSAETDAIRELWAYAETIGRGLHVLELRIIADRYRWGLLVRVPYCRFARAIVSREELDTVLRSVDEWEAKQKTAVPVVGPAEEPSAVVPLPAVEVLPVESVDSVFGEAEPGMLF